MKDVFVLEMLRALNAQTREHNQFPFMTVSCNKLVKCMVQLGLYYTKQVVEEICLWRGYMKVTIARTKRTCNCVTLQKLPHLIHMKQHKSVVLLNSNES
jgi:hypothetical protein